MMHPEPESAVPDRHATGDAALAGEASLGSGLAGRNGLTFPIERVSAVSIVDQIVARIGAAIRQGVLGPGVKLPSIRSLARRLGVSAHSVVEAYDRLSAGGLVVPRAGSGVFVAVRSPLGAAGTCSPDTTEPIGLALAAIDAQGAGIVPGNGYLPPAWTQEAWTPQVLARVQRRLAATLPAAAPPQGAEALRAQISAKLAAQGVLAAPDRVLIAYGSSHALSVVMQTCLAPGDAVLVEDPGYFMLFPMLERHGVRLLPVERHPDGPDLTAVEAACRLHRPKAFFVQSVLHNPTGWTATPANLHRLLSLAEQYGLLLVEDDAYGDLHPGAPVRLAQLGDGDRVVYVSGFTKTLGPGARVGFLVASRARIEIFLRTKALSVLTGSAVDELLVLETLAAGQYRRYLDRVRPKLAAARAATMQHLAALGLRTCAAGEPGLFIWAGLPGGWDATRLADEAYRRGVLLARGELFRPGRQPSDHLRFNATRCNDPRLFAMLREAARACGFA
jgi:DNA-binding transcriptional MocR family regulator